MKTIADIVVEVLNETDDSRVTFGDARLLDIIAERCAHTSLMQQHPAERHTRILNGLEGDERFNKYVTKMKGVWGQPYWRMFELKKRYQTTTTEAEKDT